MNETGDAVPLQKPLRYHVGGPMFDTDGNVIQAHGDRTRNEVHHECNPLKN